MNSFCERKYLDFELLETGVLSWVPDSGTVKIFFDGELATTTEEATADAPSLSEPSTICVMKTPVGSWEFLNATKSLEYSDGDQASVKLQSQITSPYSARVGSDVIFSIAELEPINYISPYGFKVSGLPTEAGEISIDADDYSHIFVSLNGGPAETFDSFSTFIFNGLTFDTGGILDGAFSDVFFVSYKGAFKTGPLAYGWNNIVLHDDIYNTDFQTLQVFGRDKHYDVTLKYSCDKSGTNYNHAISIVRNNVAISTVEIYTNYNVSTQELEDFVITDAPLITTNQFTNAVILPIARTTGGTLKVKTRCLDTGGYWNNRYNVFAFPIYAESGAGTLVIDNFESVEKKFKLFATYERFQGKFDTGDTICVNCKNVNYFLPISSTGQYVFELNVLTKTGTETLKISAGFMDDDVFVGSGTTQEIEQFFLIPEPDNILTFEVEPC